MLTHPAGKRACWKRAAVLLLAALMCFGLSSCRLIHYSRWEVLYYLHKKYPGTRIKMSLLRETKAESGPNAWIWNCCFADTPGAVFQVEDSWSAYGYTVDGYQLSDNAASVFWDYYLDLYRSQVGSLDAWEIKGYSYRTDSYALTLYYDSMEQVYLAAEQLQALHDWLPQQPHAESTFGTIRIDYVINIPLPNWFRRSKTYYSYDNVDSVVKNCGDELKFYCAYYGLPFDGCTEEELQAYALEQWPWNHEFFGIWHGGEQIPAETFAGIALYNECLSYAGFYEMLSRLEFDVEGTPEHFSFTGADGCLYEFSYDFFEETDGGSLWYFTCGAEHMTSGPTSFTGGAPLLSLEDEKLQDMAGLQFIYE